MSKIKSIRAREIIDSRGYPTIEGQLTLNNDVSVVTAIPAGTSVGKYEAFELRDSTSPRMSGMGVQQAVSYVNDLLGPKLVGASPTTQKEIDEWLIKADGSKNKSKLGGNTLLVISQLITKAGAVSEGLTLFNYVNQLFSKRFEDEVKIEKIPTPIFNILNGGAHGNHNMDFQEFQIIPTASLTFTQAFEVGIDIFHELKKVLEYRNANVSIGEEGGFTPNLKTNVDGLEVLNEAILRRGLKTGLDVFLGLDIAASYFYQKGTYRIKDKSAPLKKDDYLHFILDLVKKYAILSIEDPINQDDFEEWKKLNSELSKERYIIGDDLIVTNPERLKKTIAENAANTVLVKPNQIGTISETLEVIEIARKNNMNYVISHRSGETNDSFIADFAVGVQSDFVKFGAPCRGERVAKYNRLLQIEQEEFPKDKAQPKK